VNWILLLALTAIAVGDLVRSGAELTVWVWSVLVFLVSAIATGALARSRGRSVAVWVGWSTIFGPLPLILLLALWPKGPKQPISS
jgi:uncharacterized membrane protein YhhN